MIRIDPPSLKSLGLTWFETFCLAHPSDHAPNQIMRKVRCSVNIFKSTPWVEVRAGRFLTKVRNSSGAVWTSFTFASNSTKKKELSLNLPSRPRGQTSEIYKGNVKGQNDNFRFFAISLIKLDQKPFSSSYINTSDQDGSFDTHIAIYRDILWPS